MTDPTTAATAAISALDTIHSFPDFLVYLRNQFFENEFLQAGVVGGALVALRGVPAKLFRWLKFWTTVEMSFNSDTADYKQIAAFVSEEVVNQRWSRQFNYQAERSWDRESYEDVSVHMGLSIGYGRHFGSYKGRFAIIFRSLEESQQTKEFKERLHIMLISRSRKLLSGLSDEVAARVAKGQTEKFVSMYINSGDWWKRTGKLPLRPLSTVFTSDRQGQKLVDHILAFDGKREECRRKGIPWRTGALLYGPPGTGKTSLIHAVASETGRSICYLSLGAVEKDQHLTELITASRDWSKTILVIEDVDATGVAVERRDDPPPPPTVYDESGAEVALPSPKSKEPPKPVTMSALLNSLDGLISPDGLVAIATTNHPEKLDPALVREGRFDLKINLGPLEFKAFAEMARLLVDASEEDLWAVEGVYKPETGAKLRALLNEGGCRAVMHHFHKVPLLVA
ncbi:ATPase family protein [Citromicrobium phage vB_CbaS-RXM]|nr:ATPase family protein [Citromicrobium phage vB_CbaS-RXM]